MKNPEEQNSTRGHLSHCVVWMGTELSPSLCEFFAWEEGVISEIKVGNSSSPSGSPRYGLFPGLVNGHTHVGDCFLPEVAVPLTLEEAFFRPDGYKYQALREISADAHIDHMTEFLNGMAATGTVVHVDFREQGAEGSRRLREASRRSGVGSIILNQFAESPQSEEVLEDANAPLPQAVLDELQENLNLADGFSESTMNDLTDQAWRQVRGLVKAGGKGAAIHCLESQGYRDLSVARTGKGDLIRALELLDPDLIVHLTVASAEEIDVLAASGKTAVLNPRANAALGLPLPPIAALMKAGVNLLLGTDNGILNGPDLFKELDFAYKLARSQWGGGRHPLPVEILKMVTSNFSKTLWGETHPGTLSVGGPATFVMVDLQKPHFRNSRELTGTLITRTSPSDIVKTIRNGRTLYAA